MVIIAGVAVVAKLQIGPRGQKEKDVSLFLVVFLTQMIYPSTSVWMKVRILKSALVSWFHQSLLRCWEFLTMSIHSHSEHEA